MADWSVRRFEERDIEAVRRLWAACEGLGTGPGDTREDLVRFLKRNPGLSRVAVRQETIDETIVGAVLCGHDGRRGFLYRLAVARDHRRQGMGQALLRECLQALAAEGIPRCMAFVLADNEEAGMFWQANGGELRGELRIFTLAV